jgi:hypothetical protein
MPRLPAATWLLPAIAVLSFPVPAHADTLAFSDPRGDAPARFDLTRTTITNGQDRVLVKQRVRDLRGGGSQIFGFNLVAGSDAVAVQTVRGGNGAVTVRAIGERECAGAHARWRVAKNEIRVSMPRECIEQGGTIRVSTMIGAGDGTAGDPADWTKAVRVAQS